jgi:hypothetical protein
VPDGFQECSQMNTSRINENSYILVEWPHNYVYDARLLKCAVWDKI